jgi:hypothetical protein
MYILPLATAGFKRITTRASSSAVAYCHHLFQRDNPDLCTKMKGDGGLRATDEERQAAAAAGIDPRRAQGLEGLTPAQIAVRQVELEKEREMRKAGIPTPPKRPSPPNSNSRERSGDVPLLAAAAAAAAGDTAGSTTLLPGTGTAAVPAASTVPSVHGPAPGPGVVSAAGDLMAELEHLRQLREKKGLLQAQTALAAALNNAGASPFLQASAAAATTGASPFLHPSAAAGLFQGGVSVPGLLPPPAAAAPASQTSTALLENQLRLQQQLEIEHERQYLGRIRQERLLEEQRLLAIQRQQLLQPSAAAAPGAAPPALSSASLPDLPPGGIHHNPALALAASSGLLTHPLGPRAPEEATVDWSNESYTDALNNYYDANRRLIATRFNTEDGKFM